MLPEMSTTFLASHGGLEKYGPHGLVNFWKIMMMPHTRSEAVTGCELVEFPFRHRQPASVKYDPVFITIMKMTVKGGFLLVINGITFVFGTLGFRYAE
jgi:hypothetical protein